MTQVVFKNLALLERLGSGEVRAAFSLEIRFSARVRKTRRSRIVRSVSLSRRVFTSMRLSIPGTICSSAT